MSYPSQISDLSQLDKNDREWKRVEGKLISLLTELKFPHPYSGQSELITCERLLTELDPLLPDGCSEFKHVEIA
jgi:hypothetical protein